MIKGTRVLLRPIIKEDLPLQHKYYQSIEHFTLNASLPQVTSIEAMDEWYELATKRDEKNQFMGIEVEGKYIGCCSMKNSENWPGNYWYGIGIGDPSYWGKGYGTEVTKLMIDYAFHYLGARRLGLGTNSKNPRAIRCFKSCGFVEEGRIRKHYWIDGSYADYVYMGLLREEWENLKTAHNHSMNQTPAEV